MPSVPKGDLTLNEELLRGSIRHAIYLQRVKAQLARETVGFLNDHVFEDVLEKLVSSLERIGARGPGSGVWTTKRYLAMVESLDELVTGGFAEASAKLERTMRDVARIESAFAVKQIASTSPVEITLGLPTARTLNSIVSTQPFQGAVTREWFEDLGKKTQARLVRQVNVGLVEGESVQQIARRIRGSRDLAYSDGVLQTSRREAEAIARTAAGHVSARSREAVYEANDDVISGVQWVSTLDTSTCPVCALRDGQVYPAGEGPRPEAHWNCRCSTTPVLRSWRELGVEIDEAPEGTRSSMDGQVAGTMKFPEWLEEQPASVQDEVLGSVRGRLWRSGELEFSDFVDDRGRTLTLADLAHREGVEIPAQYRN